MALPTTLSLSTYPISPAMPFKSKAQRGYMEAHKEELEKKGVSLKEWERASKGKKLPERAPKRKK